MALMGTAKPQHDASETQTMPTKVPQTVILLRENIFIPRDQNNYYGEWNT